MGYDEVRLAILKLLYDSKNGKLSEIKIYDKLGIRGLDLFNYISPAVTALEFKNQLDYLEDKSLIGRKPSTIPGRASKEQQLNLSWYEITAYGTDIVEGSKITVAQTMEVTKLPLVFISYDTNDIDLAYAIDSILKRIFGNKIQTFIARRDIKAGEDSFRKMLHDNLSKCSAVIAVCTKQSINSSWLWFEAGAGFGNSNLIPIWAGVMPEDFKAPMTIFQGKNTADKIQMCELMNRIAEIIEFSDINCDLTEDEFRHLQKVTISLKSSGVSQSKPLQGEIRPESGIEISISYKKMKIESERHDYQLLIELTNKSSVPLENYHVDVVIPSRILENPEKHPLIVRDRSSHTDSFFRFNNELRLRNIMPGDSAVVMVFDYYMTHDIYSKRGDLFDQVVRATLYHYGFQPLTVEKAIKDLQVF